MVFNIHKSLSTNQILPHIWGKENQNLGLEKGQEKSGILPWQKSGNPVYTVSLDIACILTECDENVCTFYCAVYNMQSFLPL